MHSQHCDGYAAGRASEAAGRVSDRIRPQRVLGGPQRQMGGPQRVMGGPGRGAEKERTRERQKECGNYLGNFKWLPISSFR